MKTNLPIPRPGYEWVIGTVYKTDKFKDFEGKISKAVIRQPYTYTDGPSVWHEQGNLYFKTSGYIRKISR